MKIHDSIVESSKISSLVTSPVTSSSLVTAHPRAQQLPVSSHLRAKKIKLEKITNNLISDIVAVQSSASAWDY